MAYTQSDLDALDAAIKSGTVHVDFPGGGGVTYRSVADMLRVRAMIAADIATADGSTPTRRIKIYSVKDL